MTKEQDKAIHLLQSYAGMTHKQTDNQGRPKLDQAIETVLNLLKEKDAEIQQKTAELAEKSAELEKKSKIIEAMEDVMVESGFYTEECSVLKKREKCPDDCYICVKQYFERKIQD